MTPAQTSAIAKRAAKMLKADADERFELAKMVATAAAGGRIG